jgi:hypothetical protein
MTSEVPAPNVGQLARDTLTNREGIVMASPGVYSKNYWLRPPGGGVEWEAKPANVQLLGAEPKPD